jgi:hypothetical protein
VRREVDDDEFDEVGNNDDADADDDDDDADADADDSVGGDDTEEDSDAPHKRDKKESLPNRQDDNDQDGNGMNNSVHAGSISTITRAGQRHGSSSEEGGEEGSYGEWRDNNWSDGNEDDNSRSRNVRSGSDNSAGAGRSNSNAGHGPSDDARAYANTDSDWARVDVGTRSANVGAGSADIGAESDNPASVSSVCRSNSNAEHVADAVIQRNEGEVEREELVSTSVNIRNNHTRIIQISDKETELIFLEGKSDADRFVFKDIYLEVSDFGLFAGIHKKSRKVLSSLLYRIVLLCLKPVG